MTTNVKGLGLRGGSEKRFSQFSLSVLLLQPGILQVVNT